MGAETPTRRKRTAREIAEQLGASPRTVRRIVAEPRGEFEARAEARRAQAVELRAQGLKYTEIAEAMGVTTGTVGRLLSDARKRAAKAAKAAE
ncbi:helix-turn-helix domain-containing protein [Rhodococcus koreensis]|uniref:helix-turn-helix domain-containing protein n=1 Tax=Rhodococcus koreensis TaxID=99653 RepID=UPI00366CC16F